MKKNFKKAVVGILSIAMAAGALSGCGAKKQDDSVVNLQYFSTTKEVDERAYNIYTTRFAEFEEYYNSTFTDKLWQRQISFLHITQFLLQRRELLWMLAMQRTSHLGWKSMAT